MPKSRKVGDVSNPANAYDLVTLCHNFDKAARGLAEFGITQDHYPEAFAALEAGKRKVAGQVGQLIQFPEGAQVIGIQYDDLDDQGNTRSTLYAFEKDQAGNLSFDTIQIVNARDLAIAMPAPEPAPLPTPPAPMPAPEPAPVPPPDVTPGPVPMPPPDVTPPPTPPPDVTPPPAPPTPPPDVTPTPVTPPPAPPPGPDVITPPAPAPAPDVTPPAPPGPAPDVAPAPAPPPPGPAPATTTVFRGA